MAHDPHSPAFLALVDDAKRRIEQMTIDEYRSLTAAGEHHVLVDVREDHEWAQARLPRAVHLGKGIIERDIERAIPDKKTPIVCYCGGGYRSALVCDNLKRMGYERPISLAGGIREWFEAGHPLERG